MTWYSTEIRTPCMTLLFQVTRRSQALPALDHHICLEGIGDSVKRHKRSQYQLEIRKLEGLVVEHVSWTVEPNRW